MNGGAIAFASPFYFAQLFVLFSALSIIFFAHFQHFCFKTNKGQQGGRGGSKLGNLERTYFLNVPISIKHGYFKLISLHITSLYALQKPL